MNAGEIIEKLDGITHDRLTYFVRAGYLKPRKIKRGSLYYNNFTKQDFEILRIAWQYITAYDMRIRSAFERATKEYADPQIKLL